MAWNGTFRISLACFLACLPFSVDGVCGSAAAFHGLTIPANLTKGVSYTSYNKAAVSAGFFPIKKDDQDAKARVWAESLWERMFVMTTTAAPTTTSGTTTQKPDCDALIPTDVSDEASVVSYLNCLAHNCEDSNQKFVQAMSPLLADCASGMELLGGSLREQMDLVCKQDLAGAVDKFPKGTLLWQACAGSCKNTCEVAKTKALSSISGCADLQTHCDEVFKDKDAAMYGPNFRTMCPKTCSFEYDETAGISVVNPPSHHGPFPLFLYFPGTGECNKDAAPLSMMQEMARRGFVSAAIEFPDYSDYGELDRKAQALVNGEHSPVGKLCAMRQVNCSAGIATSGYSQGAHLTVLLAKHEPRITAALQLAGGPVIDVHGGNADGHKDIVDDDKISPYLPKHKRRSVSVDGDEIFNRNYNTGARGGIIALTNQKRISGYDCGSNMTCLQSDGSGFVIIPHDRIPPLQTDCIAGLESSYHQAFFDCTNIQWLPWFSEGKEVWGRAPNLDWLAKAAAPQHKYRPPTAMVTWDGTAGKGGTVSSHSRLTTIGTMSIAMLATKLMIHWS